MSNELVVIEEQKVIEVFSADNGLSAIILQARETVASFEHDLSTAAGRKRTASLANKVAKLKVKLDSMGKDSTADLKAKAKLVDGNRKLMRDELDELKVEARKPLTDWEEGQAVIEAEIKFNAEWDAAIADNVTFNTALAHELEVAHMEALLDNIAFDKAVEEAKEVERLRIEAEEKERIDREEEMKRQAAETARIAAEAKAKEEADRLIREKQEAEALAESQRQAAIQAELDAEEAEQRRVFAEEEAKRQAEAAEKARIEQEAINKRNAEEAEKLRVEREKKVESDRIAAQEQAKRDAEYAAEQSRLREVARQEQAEAEEKQKLAAREANIKHVTSVRTAAKEAIMALGASEELAIDIVKALNAKQIPNCQINY